jgi:hypothetical protein
LECEIRIEGIEIYDVYGGKVGVRFPFNVLEGWQPKADGVIINISHLHAGIYFIRIETKTGTLTKKIINH